MDLDPMPWSVNALGRLGTCLRDGVEPPPALPDYGDVMLWYNDFATAIQSRLMDLDFSNVLGSRVPLIVSRSKTVDTLAEKLRRDRTLKLPKVQDIAGVRLECTMNLRQQDDVVQLLTENLTGDLQVKVKDLRDGSHSGYRAVHLWIRSEQYRARAEVQIRTAVQAHWANAYETLADMFGREIRYGSLPDDPSVADVVVKLQKMSTSTLSGWEHARTAAEERIERHSGAGVAEPAAVGSDIVGIRRELYDQEYKILTGLLTTTLFLDQLKSRVDPSEGSI
ncbi:hypothetical protein [Arthrobacter sp. RAF14]|uniref:hypothetical protein n=1 Tax=Arthrobacter sp. RAF14 TaxID=3233051 RepID=UPI003F9265DF